MRASRRAQSKSREGTRMSLPMRKFEPEKPMEERVARLEAHVEHIQADVTEIKGGIRRLDAKIDAGLDRVRESIAALSDRMDRKFAWLIGLMLTLAAGCASGFLWLA